MLRECKSKGVQNLREITPNSSREKLHDKRITKLEAHFVVVAACRLQANQMVSHC